jgi:crotonobetainyl-CoA:carnitine CoA-transferase CaiB-like acyl-CoA transferase
VWRTAPALGEDNQRVYSGYLGLTKDEIDTLGEAGTI